MNLLVKRKYSFRTGAYPDDTLAVIRFTGTVALSAPYAFEILLASSDPMVEPAQLLHFPGRLIVHREAGGDVAYPGVVTRAALEREVDGVSIYRLHLVPRLAWLNLTRHNQVFLDQGVPDFLSAVLRDGGLTSSDYDFRLQGEYPPREYVCQYGESLLQFIQRWTEREGISYFFETGGESERAVFTDTQLAHVPPPQGDLLTYAPLSGQEAFHLDETVQRFVQRRSLLPARVHLRDYNYRLPGLELAATAEVDGRGRGTRYCYGEHFRTPEEGQRLARLRAEALLCRRDVFLGESSVPYIAPGFTFTLQRHFRDRLNGRYLTIGMEVEGSQAGYLTTGLRQALAEREGMATYRNRFTAIPAEVQFRPECQAPRAVIHGTLPARVDAAGSGQYAELDDQGRYTVVMPFDESGRGGGKASCRLRLVQPYGGVKEGLHAPLHKGTEVVVGFVGGDPDRPVLLGAIPNAESPSPVTAANATRSILRTGSGNKVHLEDLIGKAHFVLHVPTQKVWMRLGSPNDPDWEKVKDWFKGPCKDGLEWFADKAWGTIEDGWDYFWEYFKLYDLLPGAKEKGLAIEAGPSLYVHAGMENLLVVGENFLLVIGAEEKLNAGEWLEMYIGFREFFYLGLRSEWGLHRMDLEGAHQQLGLCERRLRQMEATCALNRTKLQGVQGRFGAVDNLVLGANQQVQQTTQHVNLKEQQMGAVHGNLAETRQAITGIRDEVVGISGNVDQLEVHAAAMRDSVSGERTEAGELTVEATELNNHITQTDTDVGNLKVIQSFLLLDGV